MISLFQRQLLLPLGVLVGYTLLMGTNPVRHCLLDGLRALRRYHRLWLIPAALGLGYTVFNAVLTFIFMFALAWTDAQPEPFGWKFTWRIPRWISLTGQAHSLRDWITAFSADPHWHVIRDGGLAGLEAVAGLFNCVVTTFPVSAIAALMLFGNWENHHSTLRVSLRKRFGRWAWAVHGGILLCAVSAIIAPVLCGPALLYLDRVAPALLLVRWASAVDWLSWLFAYLFGVGVQIYLILVVYTWLRGITWTSAHLMDLAIRRFAFVVKWAAVVMVFSSLLIDLPRISAMLFRFNDAAFFDQTLAFIDYAARPLLAVGIIFFSTMQITLTFHSETIGKAMAQHWQYLRRYWWQYTWYLLIAGIHLFGLELLNAWLALGLGGYGTLAGLVWSLIHPLAAAFLAAWLLAAWVSLYKRCETGRLQTPDWIPY